MPTADEALVEPFAAFPGWFLRIECDRCGKVVMVNEAHAPWRILTRMRHDGWGAGCQAELLTGIKGIPSRPEGRIVLR